MNIEQIENQLGQALSKWYPSEIMGACDTVRGLLRQEIQFRQQHITREWCRANATIYGPGRYGFESGCQYVLIDMSGPEEDPIELALGDNFEDIKVTVAWNPTYGQLFDLLAALGVVREFKAETH